jgi:hypothetical protein
MNISKLLRLLSEPMSHINCNTEENAGDSRDGRQVWELFRS